MSALPFEEGQSRERRMKGKRPGAGVHRGAGRFWVTLPPFRAPMGIRGQGGWCGRAGWLPGAGRVAHVSERA